MCRPFEWVREKGGVALVSANVSSNFNILRTRAAACMLGPVIRLIIRRLSRGNGQPGLRVFFPDVASRGERKKGEREKRVLTTATASDAKPVVRLAEMEEMHQIDASLT